MASSDEVFVGACADVRLTRFRRACAKAAREESLLDAMQRRYGYAPKKTRKGRKSGRSNRSHPAR